MASLRFSAESNEELIVTAPRCSLRSVSKSIEALLSSKASATGSGSGAGDGAGTGSTDVGTGSSTSYSLDTETAENIQLYIEKHPPDPAEATRLHDELVRIHKAYVLPESHPDSELYFVRCLIDFVPCLINTDSIEEWFGRYSGPAIDSAGHRNALVKLSREFLLALLLVSTNNNMGSLSDQDNESASKIKSIYLANSRKVAQMILAQYLKGDDGDYSFTSNVDNMLKGKEGMKSEERRRFAKSNAQNILIQYGMKAPVEFLTVVSDRFGESKLRIQLLALLSSYVSQQPPYLFQIRSTPLLDNLYQCLIRDKSSFGLSICATVVAMILPHICDIVVDQLPKLFAIYGRLCSWQLELGSEEDDADAASDEDDEKHSKDETCTTNSSDNWQVLNNLIDIQDARGPIITPLFTFLYGLFPVNLICFIRQPNEYLSESGYKRPFDDFWDKHYIQELSRPCLELHTLNPSMISMTREQELTDKTRWQFMGSAYDIASLCLSLYNPRQDFNKRPSHQVVSISSTSSRPQFRLPFEEVNNLIDPESQQNADGEIISASNLTSDYDTPELVNPAVKRLSVVNVPPSILSRTSSSFDPTATGGPIREDSLTSPSTATNGRNSFLSPGLPSVEALLSDHEKLYSRREILPTLEKRDSMSAIPDELRLDDVVSPTDPGPSTANNSVHNLSVDVNNNKPGTNNNNSTNSSLNTLRRGRSGTISSPAFIPTSQNTTSSAIHSPLLLSQPNQVAAAAASSIAAASANVSAPGTGTTSSPNIPISSPTTGPQSAAIVSHEQLEKQFNLTIAFYQRELLLIQNELEFVSFVEHQTQHRFSELRQKLKDSILANAQVDKLITQNKALKAALEKPELEAAKYQKSLKTYKSERQAYEGSLVQRNKDFRTQINNLNQQLEQVKSELEQITTEKKALLESVKSQEITISKMELDLTAAKERTVLFDSLQKAFEELKQKVEVLERQQENTDKSNPQVDVVQGQLEQLRLAYHGLEADKDKIVTAYDKRIEELEKLVADYETRMNRNNGPPSRESSDISQFIESFKKASEVRYNQLNTAYNELVDRFEDLSVRFREVLLNDEEHKARIDQPVLPKRSLLGYEMVRAEEENVSESNGVTKNIAAQPPQHPHPLVRNTTETRIRGRGGVQNTSNAPVPNSPGSTQSKRRPFRGYG
ncbi:hypothetical protein AWJ20_4812 [Sugiyamaella lignohabitans]|uniref:Uncharacterized protein n=1 Tax=Sugiyamaella lignohabitans TaxID=796027 RepID=A0A167EB81_9ASCO|nr:uncharacterized protein AWJ20_4812 [Sugiyamaella lignohabitans]ANB13861.1 hypothetical protein AWJ20_4812 [Sugiyamaella lignohabitans]